MSALQLEELVSSIERQLAEREQTQPRTPSEQIDAIINAMEQRLSRDGTAGTGDGTAGSHDGAYSFFDSDDGRCSVSDGDNCFSAEDSDGDELSSGADEGGIDRCGTFGCLLPDKHSGLHEFPAPQRRRSITNPLRFGWALPPPMPPPMPSAAANRAASAAILAAEDAASEAGTEDAAFEHIEELRAGFKAWTAYADPASAGDDA